MAGTEDFGTFFQENRKLVKEYLEIRLEIIRLKWIRAFSISAGHILWIIISLFLLFLFFIFLGMVAGFWLSGLTGSYVKGFGLTALVILAFIALLALFRKPLFINPLIRLMIKKMDNERQKEDTPS